MTDNKSMSHAEKIRHNLGAFQMLMMAGRDEAALKMLQNIYDVADDLAEAYAIKEDAA
tara:strand:+ start:2508 stop:2681 length:174 start_codon:yes stop_codon:yes gene_type:complete